MRYCWKEDKMTTKKQERCVPWDEAQTIWWDKVKKLLDSEPTKQITVFCAITLTTA